MGHSRAEVEAAFQTFLQRGVVERDWPAWAALFTDDAEYIEHNLGHFQGQPAIHDWIVGAMTPFPNMTFSVDWHVIEGDRVAFYIWNHLPDPEGGDAFHSFPNISLIDYAGDGKWSREEDFYNPADANRVVGGWYKAGGSKATPENDDLVAPPDWAPTPSPVKYEPTEVEAAFHRYVQRGRQAVESGDWETWSKQFVDDARYFEHHYGRFNGRQEIKDWIVGVMQPFPEMDFPTHWYGIEGNRVVFVAGNRLPDPAGGSTTYEFPACVVLHYAGDDQWSYEEDCYNPDEAPLVIADWLAAGGELPEGLVVPELEG
jgi:predicted SnoaL-like aldol condensation-catalyzing enzyme